MGSRRRKRQDDSVGVPYFIADRLFDEGGACSNCEKKRKSVRPRAMWILWPAGRSERAEAELCTSCWRAFRDAGDDFESAFKNTAHFMPELARKWLAWNKALKFQGVDWKTYFHLEVFQLIRDARVAFLFGAHAGCIALISGAVERALKCDERLTVRRGGRLGLNLQTLSRALESGLPVEELLGPDESLTGEHSPKPRFIVLRNAIAHGDMMPEIASQFFAVKRAELLAAEQLHKGQKFLRRWSASPGNPPRSGEYEPVDGEMRREWIKRTFDASALNIGFHNPFDGSGWT